MRHIEEIAREIVEHGNPKNLPSLLIGHEIVELAKAALFWRDRFERAREQFDGWRHQNEHLRDAIRLAETTRDAAQAIATRETLRRRKAEEELGKVRSAMREQLVDVVENERIKRHTVADGDAYARGKADGYGWCAEEILRRLRETTGPAFEKETATDTLMVRAGDVLEGVEGDVTTRIHITYVSEETLMARQLRSRRADGMEVGDPGRESTWTLSCRDWRKVEEGERDTQNGDEP